MSEIMARALGAPGALTATIAGKECTVRPLGIQELTEVERDCVQRYKRGFLETYSQNLDLLPKERGEQLLEQKMAEVARWDVDNLPPKWAHDPKRIKVTEALKKWLKENLELKEDADDERLRRMAASALDQGMLTEEQYRNLTDAKPPRVRVGYVNWWITGSYDGMITFVWVCFRHNGVTREQCVEALRGNMALLVDLSREIERLSSPTVGNG